MDDQSIDALHEPLQPAREAPCNQKQISGSSRKTCIRIRRQSSFTSLDQAQPTLVTSEMQYSIPIYEHGRVEEHLAKPLYILQTTPLLQIDMAKQNSYIGIPKP